MNPHSVGIVTALATEAQALTRQRLHPQRLTPVGKDARLWLSGMGQEAARQGALALIDAGATALVVFGVAGALTPGLRSGTLLCPQRIFDERGRDYTPTPSWRAALSQRLEAAGLALTMEGSLLSLPAPLWSAAQKTAMRDRHLAVAVDMESAAVAAIASERQLPFLVLRAIVDESDDEIPLALQAGIDEWGRARPLSMLLVMARHPGLLKRLPGLASRMGKATRALQAAVVAAGTDLAREAQGPC
ncbi:purine and other phosphorylase-like protein, family 1 [Dyella halodurans]|uniref:Purine and other phosphorylase-like protein, family 1 n=1 Tax=Dyella halodurans TaxID=1920171 RepID=A0ABV9C377_9GAMM|nr:purine and other phosphorylase-like protein, family 1 [Dyella halodurans]